MGRRCYEKVLTMGEWAYDKPVLVLSRKLAGTPVPEVLQGKVRFSDCTPTDAMSQLEATGMRRVYVDGGQLVQSFLRDGLIAASDVRTSAPAKLADFHTPIGKHAVQLVPT